MIKKLKSLITTCFLPIFSFFLSFLSFTCFYMKLHIKVVFLWCHGLWSYSFLHAFTWYGSGVLVNEISDSHFFFYESTCFYMKLHVRVRSDLLKKRIKWRCDVVYSLPIIEIFQICYPRIVWQRFTPIYLYIISVEIVLAAYKPACSFLAAQLTSRIPSDSLEEHILWCCSACIA